MTTNDVIGYVEVMERNLEVFKEYKDGTTAEQLANKYGVTVRTIYNWIAKARVDASNDLARNSKNYKADVYYQLKHVYDLAEREFLTSQNPNFLKEMRLASASIATLLGLNAPPKSAVSDSGDESEDQLILVLNDEEYKEAERLAKLSLENNTVEAQ